MAKFSSKGPKKPHLLRGRGVGGEVADLRKDVEEYLESTFNTIERGTFATEDNTPLGLATVQIPVGEARAVSAGVRGTEADTPVTHFFMHEVRVFKNTGGVVTEIVPDDGSNPSSKKHRENVAIDLTWVAGAGTITPTFTGAAANDCAGVYYVEVL